MLKIQLYEDARGRCPVNTFYSAIEASGGKNAKIQAEKFRSQVAGLQRLGAWEENGKAVKKLRNKVWELRPGKNRVLFFHWKDDIYILLHAFHKTTGPTPSSEIEKAEKEINDWIMRHGQ